MEILVEILGYLGMILLLLGWALTRRRPIDSTLISMTGGLVMTFYGFFIVSVPVILLEGTWVLIGFYNLKKIEKEGAPAPKVGDTSKSIN